MELLDDGSFSPRTYEITDVLKQNQEPRTIIVPDEAFEIEHRIKKIQFQNGNAGGLLFPSTETEYSVAGKLYRLCDDLGIGRRSPHKCRKTYISNLLNNGMDLDFVREQAGHKDLQTTLNAYTFSTTRDEENIRKLNDILGSKTACTQKSRFVPSSKKHKNNAVASLNS